jgi:prenyltransferase beta subunit
MMLMLISLATVLSGMPPNEKEKQATIQYLRELQIEKGAFRATAKGNAGLRSTVAAVRALGYFGSDVPRSKAVSDFVLACQDAKTGGFADTPGGQPDPIVTAVALMGLSALKLDDAKRRDRAVAWMVAQARSQEEIRMAAAGLEAAGVKGQRNAQWIAALQKEQNADGTFGKGASLAWETGGKVACLLRLGVTLTPSQKHAIVQALDQSQQRDGGFAAAAGQPSDLPTTYRVLRTYHLLGRKPARSADLYAFLAKCRNADGGYGVAPGQGSSASGCYMVGIILSWLSK